METRTVRSPYLAPLTETVSAGLEILADITSFNPDIGHSPNLPVIEGDPDDDDDGKGAKGNDIWDDSRFTSRALWDD